MQWPNTAKVRAQRNIPKRVGNTLQLRLKLPNTRLLRVHPFHQVFKVPRVPQALDFVADFLVLNGGLMDGPCALGDRAL